MWWLEVTYTFLYSSQKKRHQMEECFGKAFCCIFMSACYWTSQAVVISEGQCLGSKWIQNYALEHLCLTILGMGAGRRKCPKHLTLKIARFPFLSEFARSLYGGVQSAVVRLQFGSKEHEYITSVLYNLHSLHV